MLSSEKAYRKWVAERVNSVPDILSGEPVFKGTRVSVIHIGLLLQKVPLDKALIKDYPNLTLLDFVMASKYVQQMKG